MRKYNRLTLQERELIEKYIKKGFSLNKISTILQKNVSTISYEVRYLGKERYNAIEAHTKCLEARDNKIKTTKEDTIELEKCIERIEILEMQVNILHETIRKMTK